MMELPLGFGMALAQNEAAMHVFEAMTDAEKQAVLEQCHQVHSKQEMQMLVRRAQSTSDGIIPSARGITRQGNFCGQEKRITGKFERKEPALHFTEDDIPA